MKVVISKKISPHNINLAHISSEKVRSEDVVQLKDLSIQYDDNLLPIFTEDRRSGVNTNGSLTIQNNTLTAEITSEYNYIKTTAEFIPLWDKYSFQRLHHNAAGQAKTIEYTVTANTTEYQFISPKSQSLVATNTLRIEYYTGSAWVAVSAAHYMVDHGRKIIRFTNFAHGFYVGKRIIIYYHTINSSILIYDDAGNKLDSKYFRIEPYKHETTPDEDDKFQVSDTEFINNIYEITLLVSDVLDPDATYFVEYTAYNVNTALTENHIEILNPLSLYDRIAEFELYHVKDSYVYTIDESDYTIYTKLPEEWSLVFVRYPYNRNSKIAPLEPQNIPHNNPWFLEVTNDKFTREADSSTWTYQILEKSKQNLINDSYIIRTSKEDVHKIASDKIKTNFNNMYLTHNNDGTITNVKIYNNNEDISSLIKYVDGRRGIIILTKTLNFSQANSYIQYSYVTKTIQYQEANINPYMVFNNTNNNMVDKFIVLFMLPTEELETAKGQSLFHVVVHKTPERYEDVDDHQKSLDAATEYIEGKSDGEGIIKLFDQPPEGTVFYFGEVGDTYIESDNKFTEGVSWDIGSGTLDTVESLSDIIETTTNQNLSTSDYRDTSYAVSGHIAITKIGDNQDIWFTVPSGETYVDIIETTNITGSRSNLYDIINDYISVDTEVLHPIILCHASATNITTPEAVKIRDIRRRGGGLPVSYAVNELTEDKYRHYLDIAKIDGYDYNLTNVAIVEIKNAVKERYKLILAKYDPYAQRQIRDNVEFNLDEYTETKIIQIVKKYLNAAAHITIKYIE